MGGRILQRVDEFSFLTSPKKARPEYEALSNRCRLK